MLAVCLLALTACGAGDGQRKEGLWYEATGISPDAVLLTVGNRDVPAQRYFYWLAYTCDYISGYYQTMGAAVDWDETLAGETLAEYAQKQALSNTALYAMVETWAERYNCQVTAEDQTSIDGEWAARVEQYGGEEAYLAALDNMGLDRGGAELLAADRYQYSHLYDLYCTEGSALYPAQADVEAYADREGYLTVDHILVSTADVAADDKTTLAQRRARAEEVLSKVRSGGDPAADFAALAEAYSDEENRADYPEGYTFAPADGMLPEAFTAAAQALAENAVSDVVETEAGYCVILRRPLDLEAVRSDYFDLLLQTAADTAEIVYSDAWKTLNPADVYAGLTAARAARTAG